MRLGILFVVLLLVFSCKKDKPFGPQGLEETVSEVDTAVTHFYVINEGNFTLSNASITDYEIETVTSRQNAFEQVNKQALGDVAQSLLVSGNTGYLFINNSNEVIKVSLPSLKEQARMTVQSPRYGLITSTGELWVTSLNKKDIFVLDTSNLNITKTLVANDWLEELVEADNHIFACNVNQHAVDVYSLEGKQIKSIAVGNQPQSIVVDNKGMVCVLCDGGYNPRDRKLARLMEIDPISLSYTSSYTFKDIENSPARLRYNTTNGMFYFLNRSVYSFTGDFNKEPQEIFKQEGSNFYGLGVDSESGNVIVTDAKDYSKRGRAYVLNSSGSLLYDFETGVIPQDVVVYR